MQECVIDVWMACKLIVLLLVWSEIFSYVSATSNSCTDNDDVLLSHLKAFESEA
jgi:hypothetical protein